MGLFKKKVERGFNSLDVSVVVEKIVNGNLIREVGEFIAVQDKTDSKSLVVVNQDFDFKEELDFVENEIISTLKKQLEFKDKTKEEKIDLLDASIVAQTNKINSIKDGKIKIKTKTKDKDGKIKLEDKKDKDGEPIEKKVNKIDEEVNLRLLQVLKEHVIDYDDRGVYEIINISGLREIRFLLVGDFLYPLYRSPNNKTIYPNMVTKKKVYKVQSDLARQEYEDAISSKIMNFFKNIMPFVVIGLLLLNIFWAIKLNSERGEIDNTIQEQVSKYQKMLSECDLRCAESAIKCSFYLSEFTKGNVDLMLFANQQMDLLTQAYNTSISISGNTQNKLREQVINKIIDETIK